MIASLIANLPNSLAERFRIPGSGGELRSDVAIVIGLKVCWLAFFVVPALDVRFGWTPPLPLWCEVCGDFSSARFSE